MKKSGLFLLVAAALQVNAQNGAAIEYKMTTGKGPTGTVKIHYSEYGTLTEFNMSVPQMPGGGIVNKGLTKKDNPDVTYMIQDKNKTYSEMKKTDPQGEDTKTYKVEKIGEEKMNGYKCVHAKITEGNEMHEVWNTKDIADYAKYSASFNTEKKLGSDKREKALKDAGCDGLPVKVFHKGNPNEGDFTLELVKLEKKNFSSSDFEIPAGYTKSEAGAGRPSNGMKSQQEVMNMTPEERARYIEEMKKMYGK